MDGLGMVTMRFQGDLHSTSYDFNDKNLELGALLGETSTSMVYYRGYT